MGLTCAKKASLLTSHNGTMVNEQIVKWIRKISFGFERIFIYSDVIVCLQYYSLHSKICADKLLFVEKRYTGQDK